MGTYLVQVVVLSNELLQLGLDVDNLRLRELKLHYRHTGLLEMLEESDL